MFRDDVRAERKSGDRSTLKPLNLVPDSSQLNVSFMTVPALQYFFFYFRSSRIRRRRNYYVFFSQSGIVNSYLYIAHTCCFL